MPTVLYDVSPLLARKQYAQICSTLGVFSVAFGWRALTKVGAPQRAVAIIIRQGEPHDALTAFK